MIYWLHRLIAPLCRLAPIRLSYSIAAIVGWLAFFVLPVLRANAVRNMAGVLGPDASPQRVRHLAQRAFMNYGKYLVDMMRLPDIDPDELERRVTVNGWEHFNEAIDEGDGLIFVGGHIGNSDLAAAVLAGRGFPVHVIAEQLHPPRWDALVQAARAAVGLRVIPLGSSALRFMRVLREKEILAFLIDRPVEEQGVAISFFGRTTTVPAGAAALALRSNARILGAYIVRSGNEYIAHISPAIKPQLTGDMTVDLQTVTQALFDWLESIIKQYPDQWFMFRPMWPTATDTLAAGST
jgi:KDO2-lipid IV(A) lauroyltransferase